VRPQRGFTLVELLVVFGLVALIAAIVPIAYDRLRDGTQYRQTLRAMLSELRLARDRAQGEGREVRFRVDLDGRRFGIDGRPQHELPESLTLRATVATIELTDGNVAGIRFLPDGGATGGSLDIVRTSGSGVRLTVDWLSGSVTQVPITP
jgi:general secretion pathway protein H